MSTHNSIFKARLGFFIIGGLTLFVFALFIIGKQKNLFDPVFKLTTTFYNVSGLQVGSNVRFSGINVGTVDDISIINDSTVKVDLLIKKDVQRFIKSDCLVALGTNGIIGDRLLIITQGGHNSPIVKEGQFLASKEPVETDAIMADLQISAVNAVVITNQLAKIMTKINEGHGTLWRLIQDPKIANNLDQTIVNLKKSSKGLDQNMQAAKSSFFLKGFFKNKEKAAQKKKDDAAKEREKAVKEKIKNRNK